MAPSLFWDLVLPFCPYYGTTGVDCRRPGDLGLPALVERVVQVGNELTVITRAVISVEAGQGEATGDILFKLNPLKYGYSMPFYTALALPAPGNDRSKLKRWLMGMLMLPAVQVFRVSTEILKVSALDVGPETRTLLGFSDWGYEGLVLAYQLNASPQRHRHAKRNLFPFYIQLVILITRTALNQYTILGVIERRFLQQLYRAST